jgi:hypothetical protein
MCVLTAIDAMAMNMKRNPEMGIANDINYKVYAGYKPYTSYGPYGSAVEADAENMDMGACHLPASGLWRRKLMCTGTEKRTMNMMNAIDDDHTAETAKLMMGMETGRIFTILHTR